MVVGLGAAAKIVAQRSVGTPSIEGEGRKMCPKSHRNAHYAEANVSTPSIEGKGQKRVRNPAEMPTVRPVISSAIDSGSTDGDFDGGALILNQSDGTFWWEQSE